MTPGTTLLSLALAQLIALAGMVWMLRKDARAFASDVEDLRLSPEELKAKHEKRSG